MPRNIAELVAWVSRSNAGGWSLRLVPVLTFYPIWKWYVARLADGSDEPWGVLALATALVFFWRNGSCIKFKTGQLVLPSLIMLVYAGTYPFAPRLVQAALAMAAVACVGSSVRLGTPVHPASLGLLLLSLPVMSSLQFYLGYPLRVISGVLAAGSLQLAGLAVVRDGACLRWGTELISIDSPCSGVRMVWAMLYLAFTLACFFRLNAFRTAALATVAFLCIVLGNAMRSSALFHLETQFSFLPEWCHSAVGVVVFSAVASACVWFCRLLGGDVTCEA
jgi:exosortase